MRKEIAAVAVVVVAGLVASYSWTVALGRAAPGTIAAADIIAEADGIERPAAPAAIDQMNSYEPRDFSHLLGMEGFSDQLLTMHFKLYQGYVKNTNKLGELLRGLLEQNKTDGPEYAGLKRLYGWEFDGMRLHEYYFENLGGKGIIKEQSHIRKRLENQWGSFDKWKQDFVATGLIRGIGWAVLYEDRLSGKLVNAWINEHDLGHLAGSQPLLIMDVFEHAYITEYGLDRKKYIEAFFNNIDWDVVERRGLGLGTSS